MATDRAELIETLFCEALERPEDERTGFLEEACGGDTELQNEVAGLLREHERAGRFMGGPSEATPPPTATGRRIGPYQLLRILGEGETSTVHLAVRSDPHFRKLVAIKLVKRGMDTDSILRRFHQERQILAELDHPNIATLHDGGTTDDGRPYFVMEYVLGERIDRYCDSNELSIGQRIDLFRTVCSAVHHAHQSLIIHRDLKPGNILITPRGEPKLLDFGIAKLLDPEIETERTATMGRLMTPRYASPEQFRGQPVTTATDVYSLGVLLYELLSGRPPYSVGGATITEIEEMVCKQQPEPPSAAVRRADDGTAVTTAAGGRQRLARRLSGDLDTIVTTALRKQPRRRYRSVQELSEDLRRHRHRLPISARRDTLGYRAGKFLRRNVFAVAAAAAVTVSLAAGLAITTWQARVARAAQARAETQQLRAEQVSEFLVEMFRVSDPERENAGDLTAREMLDRGADGITSELSDQPEVQATLMDTMGVVYRNLGDADRAGELITQGLEIRQQTLGAEHPDVADSIVNLASAVRLQGDYARAEQLNREALALLRELYDDEHPRVLGSLSDLAIVLHDQGEYDEAEQLLREALRLQRAHSADDTVALTSTLNNLAMVLTARGEYEEAEQLHREAVEMAREAHGGDHPTVAVYLNNLAGVLDQAGKYDESERYHREALAMRRIELGDDHPALSHSLSNLASVVRRQGRLEEGEQLVREALGIYKRSLGVDHPRYALMLANLALLVDEQDRQQEAEQLFRQALPLTRKSFGERHPQVAFCLTNLASMLSAQGRFDEAAAMHREALGILREVHGEQHPHVAVVLNNLAMVKYRQKNLDEAVELQRQVLSSYRELLGSQHPNTATCARNLAAMLREIGDADEAEALYRESIDIYRESLPAGHVYLGKSLLGLGVLLVETGKAEQAEPLLREAVDLRSASYSDDDWRVAEAESALGACLTSLGRFEEAEGLLLSSHPALVAHFGEGSEEAQRARARLAELYDASSRTSQ